MNIPPSDARELTYYEYSALLANWEAMHSNEPEPITDDDIEFEKSRADALAAIGIRTLQ
jgi:hypothetical protein